VRLFYQEILFIRDSEEYLNEGSAKGQLYPQGSSWGTWQEVRFSADFDRHMEDSGNRASLSM
jgi:hypothetical protein